MVSFSERSCFWVISCLYTGEILSDGVAIGEPSLNKGVVFQDYGLFPWMSAGENILLALKQRYPKRDKKELKEIAVNGLFCKKEF